MSAVDGWAKRLVLQALERIERGQLRLEEPDGARTFGRSGDTATLCVHHPRFFRRVVTAGEMGLGEAYLDGDWSTPDLVALVRLMLANRELLVSLPALPSWLSRQMAAIAHRRRDNTRPGSRRNIGAHYDLGNDFFELFLDRDSRMYSCAVFARAGDTLEAAQTHKLRLICDKLALAPGDRVLEIGSGWGGFAVLAARDYGCHVTTTTISARQYEFVQNLVGRSGLAARIDPRFEDYRDLQGRFDKIVSIEMFEAVGLRHYDEFFGACDRLLTPDGLMLLQTITVDDWRFDEYLRSPSWIAEYIFPGAELASVAEILASLSRVTTLSLHHAQQIGTHYARTLGEWRARFRCRLDAVRAQGFDERFVRMWDLYLAYCEAAFLERHIGDVQLLLSKAANRRVLFDEPWAATPAIQSPALLAR